VFIVHGAKEKKNRHRKISVVTSHFAAKIVTKNCGLNGVKNKYREDMVGRRKEKNIFLRSKILFVTRKNKIYILQATV